MDDSFDEWNVNIFTLQQLYNLNGSVIEEMRPVIREQRPEDYDLIVVYAEMYAAIQTAIKVLTVIERTDRNN